MILISQYTLFVFQKLYLQCHSALRKVGFVENVCHLISDFTGKDFIVRNTFDVLKEREKHNKRVESMLVKRAEALSHEFMREYEIVFNRNVGAKCTLDEDKFFPIHLFSEWPEKYKRLPHSPYAQTFEHVVVQYMKKEFGFPNVVLYNDFPCLQMKCF